jgi:hypothetical protein
MILCFFIFSLIFIFFFFSTNPIIY